MSPTTINLFSRKLGRCPSCGGAVLRGERVVRLHGDVFHSECASYRSRAQSRAPTQSRAPYPHGARGRG